MDALEYMKVAGVENCKRRFQFYVRRCDWIAMNSCISGDSGKSILRLQLLSSDEMEPRFASEDSSKKNGESDIDIEDNMQKVKARVVKLSSVSGRSCKNQG